MTRDDIIRMAREAEFIALLSDEAVDGLGGVWADSEIDITDNLSRFAALVAAEKEQQMIRDGWRQCAKGQRTTQYCGLLDAAVKDEREACALMAQAFGRNGYDFTGDLELHEAIRARGKRK